MVEPDMVKKKGEEDIMKKFTKISLVLSGLFAGIGILLILIASIMGAGFHTLRQMAIDGSFHLWNWHVGENGFYYSSSDDDLERGEQGSSFDSGEVENLVLEVGQAEILFADLNESDKITVQLENGVKSKYSCSLEDGTLTVRYVLKHHSAIQGGAVITIGIPEGMTFDTMDFDIGASSLEINASNFSCSALKMDVGAGDMDAEYLNVTDKMDLTLGVGDVDISDGAFGELRLECGLGVLNLGGAVSGDVTAHCGMGEIDLELRGDENDYDYDLSCGMGSLEVNGSSYGGIGGSKTIRNEGATKRMKLQCGMGNVEVSLHDSF